MKTLLLWDIDGTLIDSGGAGALALQNGLKNEFGIADDLRWFSWAGRTDTWIAKQILQRHAIEVTPANIEKLLEGYLANVGDALKSTRARILPGVDAILAWTSQQPTLAQGLLTGNLERGARIKLGHFDLWKFFAFGAFADDSELRNDLGPHAITRAAAHHKTEFHADRVIVIGDTPFDIECGRAANVRTLAVATGKFSRAELQEHRPDYALDDLSDTEALKALFNG